MRATTNTVVTTLRRVDLANSSRYWHREAVAGPGVSEKPVYLPLRLTRKGIARQLAGLSKQELLVLADNPNAPLGKRDRKIIHEMAARALASDPPRPGESQVLLLYSHLGHVDRPAIDCIVVAGAPVKTVEINLDRLIDSGDTVDSAAAHDKAMAAFRSLPDSLRRKIAENTGLLRLAPPERGLCA